MSNNNDSKNRETVRKAYSQIAVKGKSCCATASPAYLAREIGYFETELAHLPEGANMGLSCGNPGAITALKPGEVVLDLGCGGGLDVFLPARN